MRTVEQHARALADGTVTSRALVEHCLARITDPNGEGSRALIKVHARLSCTSTILLAAGKCVSDKALSIYA